MIKKEDKKGSITAKQFVTVVLLLASFVIIFLVFFQIDWTGEIDRKVCHQSVILRATVPAVGQALVPLKCKTSKICVTSGLIGGKCEDDFTNVKGITKAKVDEVKQVEKLIAQEIVGCWSMMGEGKVSLFSQYWAETYGIGGVYPTCVICSRIAFDEKLDLSPEKLKEMNVLRYMKEYKIPNGNVSYYEYLTKEGGKISVEGSPTIKNIVEGKTEEGKKIAVVSEEDSTSIEGIELEDPLKEDPKGELAILFMQISAPSHKDAALNLGQAVLGIGGAGAYFAGPSAVVGTIKAVGLKGGLIVLGVAILGMGAQQINIAYNREVTAGYCGDISVGQEARNGCSVVRAINYNKTAIKKYCSVIESIS